MSFYQDFIWETGIRETTDFKKVAKNGSSMKFDPTFTQEQLAMYVLMRADHIPLSGFATGRPDDFVWKFIPHFDIKKTDAIKSDWAAWFKGEQDEWQYNHGDERKDHFEKWLKNPFEKPVIFIEGTGGKWHIWDGHHRVGIAHIAKLKTIPALVGRRKSSLANGMSDIDADIEQDTDTNSTGFPNDV